MFWKKKKKKKYRLDSVDLFMANDCGYLERHPVVKEELIERQKEYRPDECLKCLFFKWLYGENNMICGGRCAAKPEIDKESFFKGGVAEGCPLMEKEETC